MKRTTLTKILLMAMILSGSITACSQSQEADRSQPDTAQSNTTQQNTAPANTPSSPTRAQRSQAIRKQIETVLTPEQTQQLETKIQQGERMRQALSSLNLTPEQKTKIQEILKASRPRRKEPAKEG